jgi:hypothetical protein
MVRMKALAVIGMIIGLLLVMTSVVNGIIYSDRIIIGEVEYLIGGLLLFFLSALLMTVRSLKDSIESLKSNTNIKQNEMNQSNTKPKYRSNYRGVPRRVGETEEEYRERLEKGVDDLNQLFPR